MNLSINRIKSFMNRLLGSRYFAVITLVLFLFIIGTAFFLVYQNANIMRNQINDDFNQQQLILARQAADQIQTNLNDIKTGVLSLQQLIQGSSMNAIKEAVKVVFKQNQNKGLIDIGFMDDTGNVFEVYSFKDTFASREGQFAKTLGLGNAGTMALGLLQMVESPGGVMAITGMFSANVNIPGTRIKKLFARIDITKLVKNVTSNIRSGKTGYAWVIDETGMFLYHPEKEFIGKDAFSVRKERKPYITFAQINSIMKERMLNGEEGTGIYISGWHRGIHEGEITKLIAFTPVKSPLLTDGHMWSVAVVAPIIEVAAAVHSMYVRHFAAEVALIAGMFLFGFIVITYQQGISRALKEQVSEKERYLSTVLQNSVDAIIFIDNDNKVQTWNKGAELIFEYTAAEMINQSFHRLVPPELDAETEIKDIEKQVLTHGYVKDYIAPRITKSGRRIAVDISRTLVQARDGKIIGSTAIIKDITDKMELEQRIYNTEKLASIGTLAAGVAHEINNPLSIILGFTDLLKEKFKQGTQEYDDLKIIEQHASQAKMIVENLLGFARITEGFEDTVDVNYCVDTVVKIVKNTLMTKKITIVLTLQENLPKIRGDSREFQQVIFNLINNSVAAMNGKEGTLTISAHRDNEWVTVTISDTGSGIPDKIKSRVFDPFFTTKKVGEGTGLGLSLCYGIVKKYGGKISYSSIAKEDHPEQQSGTTFTVSLPVFQESGSGKPAKGA
ncbi:MAG: ATP-binding protein [Deltaproteobacteria bacterium]|nr:ATP-binding protein [Deltaproteobacteria bacterium]